MHCGFGGTACYCPSCSSASSFSSCSSFWIFSSCRWRRPKVTDTLQQKQKQVQARNWRLCDNYFGYVYFGFTVTEKPIIIEESWTFLVMEGNWRIWMSGSLQTSSNPCWYTHASQSITSTHRENDMYKTPACGQLKRLTARPLWTRPICLISEAKQGRAWLVLGWATRCCKLFQLRFIQQRALMHKVKRYQRVKAQRLLPWQIGIWDHTNIKKMISGVNQLIWTERRHLILLQDIPRGLLLLQLLDGLQLLKKNTLGGNFLWNMLCIYKLSCVILIERIKLSDNHFRINDIRKSAASFTLKKSTTRFVHLLIKHVDQLWNHFLLSERSDNVLVERVWNSLTCSSRPLNDKWAQRAGWQEDMQHSQCDKTWTTVLFRL